jgi:hypothetical protein
MWLTARRCAVRRSFAYAVAGALVVTLVPVPAGAADSPVVERRKVGDSILLATHEPRRHALPTKRATATSSDFDGDRVDDVAVTGDQVWWTQQPADQVSGPVAVRYSTVQRDDVFLGVVETPRNGGGGFGHALATGDFNRDGFDDLVVGEPWDYTPEASGSSGGPGAVWVLPGSPTGLHLSTARRFSQATLGVGGTPHSGDEFGSELASGDLDRDGYDDLVVGAPRAKVGSTSRAGLVVVIRGGQHGLSRARAQMITLDTPGVPGSAKTDARFGASLAVGRITSDWYLDLVVNYPGSSIMLVPGGAQWLAPASSSVVTQYDVWDAVPKKIGSYVFGLGAELLTADVDGDGLDEVVAGAAESQARGSAIGSGAVVTLEAHGSRLGAAGARVITLETPGMPGTVQAGDRFGDEIVAADLDLDGRDDVAVGAPNRAVAGHGSAGAVYVLRGSSTGLGTRGVVQLTQSSVGAPGDPQLRDQFGIALAMLDVDGSGRRDLVVGAVEDRVGSEGPRNGSGSVTVFRNVWGKLTGDSRWGGRDAGTSGARIRLTYFGRGIAHAG